MHKATKELQAGFYNSVQLFFTPFICQKFHDIWKNSHWRYRDPCVTSLPDISATLPFSLHSLFPNLDNVIQHRVPMLTIKFGTLAFKLENNCSSFWNSNGCSIRPWSCRSALFKRKTLEIFPRERTFVWLYLYIWRKCDYAVSTLTLPKLQLFGVYSKSLPITPHCPPCFILSL